ncbi:C-type lectin domain family 12 member B-like isoform X3 [Poeciliopsis prolifica]|uniref:C-type lectin domain family 12 member B-like isoform X3 n=1 Tax=Poeciliopsis prolifica TaxID=188132 RepID=UPI0024142A89|nr:C-type lectin domain family 12 member B-like isoform X3 [Poeciliopsis prolifica]
MMEDKVDEEIYSTVTDIQDEPSPQSKEEEDDEPEEQQALTKSRLYLVGLGIFIGLIAGTLIYMSVRMVTVLENINHLTTKRMQLISETKTMEEEIVELNQEIDKKCEPCPNKWILFKNKCYLFYDSPPPWKTWEESQRFCQNKRTRLLTIGSLEEQEFVSKHIKYYMMNTMGTG